jgi:ferrochelatase
MARKSSYTEEIKVSSSLVAGELNHGRWSVCYQSRSGNPRDPWLEPDVCSVIRELGKKGGKAVLLIPIGFLCENAEILYDLDVEARREAKEQGLKYFRASTVMGHPKFVSLLTELIEAECVRV